MRSSRFNLLLAALAPMALLAGCHKGGPTTEAGHPPRAVTVTTVETRPIVGALAASGDLVPREEAAVLPEVGGYRVAEVLADVGQSVRRGEVLARLDPALIQAQVAQQEALTAQAEAQAAQAEDQAARVRGLDNSGVLSQEQIRQRRLQARAARATARAQAALLRDVRTRAGKLAVTAPVAGLVLEKTVRPGDLSSLGGAPWFRLAADGQMELQAQLSEDDLARIRRGQRAQVTLPSGAVAAGVVRLISPQIDPQTKLGFVRITLPPRSDIRSGGFARAVFTDAQALTPAVPETAVRYDADGASLMVVQPDNRVRRVRVRTGARGGGLVQIAEGPPVGSRIVQAAASFLMDGDVVKPVIATAAVVPGR
jgi:HlyD family secretion protein